MHIGTGEAEEGGGGKGGGPLVIRDHWEQI